MKIKKVCKQCGKEFEIEKANKEQVFCNRRCWILYKKINSFGKNNPFYGKKHTLETKETLCRSHKGYKHTDEARKKMSISRKGKSFTIEHRRAISESHLKNLFSTHKLSSENKNVLRKRFDYKIWRENVFKRDNWTCKKCLKKGGYLEAHHIKSFNSFPDLRYVVLNGITLCRDCHKQENIKQMKGNKNGIKRNN
jgi:5-methylcytosine-specific restriction endonuclease McrA